MRVYFLKEKYAFFIILKGGYVMNEVIEKEIINVEDMIYEIRGKQVMLDTDLATLYHCKNGTKTINLAVKRHVNRFPERFMFQLTEEESKKLLRFQFETLNKSGNQRGQHLKYLPYVFTEQGVAMLATVLRTEVAEEVSIKIMDAFVAMRHYIGNNEYRLLNIESKIIEHDSDIKLLQESFSKFEEKKKVNDIYFTNQIYDAYSKIKDIFLLAEEELVIIDSYADKTVLDMIKDLSVKVLLITKYDNKLSDLDIEKYNKQYFNLKVIRNNDFHDRYFILDKQEVYHCGTSINYAGSKVFSINILEDIFVKKSLINKINMVTDK